MTARLKRKLTPRPTAARKADVDSAPASGVAPLGNPCDRRVAPLAGSSGQPSSLPRIEAAGEVDRPGCGWRGCCCCCCCGCCCGTDEGKPRPSPVWSKAPPVPLASCLVVSRVEDWADARRASRPGRFSDGTDGMGGDDITRGFKPSLGSEEDMARVPGSPH